jgi:DNA polymerase III epsilon subunit-like protein
MCYARPFPRCSNHTRKALAAAQLHMNSVAAKHPETSLEFQQAKAELSAAKAAYRATPEGIKAMENSLKNADLSSEDAKAIQSLIIRSKTKRASQLNALHEHENGRASLMYEFAAETHNTKFDKEELSSIIATHVGAVASKNGSKLSSAAKVEQAQYDEFVNKLDENPDLTDRQKEIVAELRDMKPCDKSTLEAYATSDSAVEKAEIAVNLEQARIGGMQNISYDDAKKYYSAYRNQYKNEYASLPESERPDPPRAWLKDDLKSGQANGMREYKYLPSDPASNYAAYRLRADVKAVPGERPTVYASIDLETAGPKGPAGFNPKKGHIIEVGVVKYDDKGKEISRYSQLIRPDDAFLEEHGTGAEDIHHISVKELDGAPTWDAVSDNVRNELDNTVMVAQNANFEQSWMQEHVPGFNHSTGQGPVIDTLDVARRHYDLPNYKLQTICEKVGVPYTNGHRATHDAEVTGDVLFKVKALMQKQWDAKPSRKNAKVISL